MRQLLLNVRWPETVSIMAIIPVLYTVAISYSLKYEFFCFGCLSRSGRPKSNFKSSSGGLLHLLVRNDKGCLCRCGVSKGQKHPGNLILWSELEANIRQISLFFVKLFETWIMVANDDLEGKTTHFTGFYTHTISIPKIPKLPIVEQVSKSKQPTLFLTLFWVSLCTAI